MIQPFITGLIEVALWSAIFTSTGLMSMNGFPRESYLAYALWAAFFSRIGSNWMYEFRMIDEIETGSVNSVLARPISFYEYYLGQFMGYKLITSVLSLIAPILIVAVISGPTKLERLPLAFSLVMYYLIFVHTMSFIVASFAFYFNRVSSFTMAKNIGLWMLSGELFPLDLAPEPFRGWLLAMPFCNAVYRPVGYLTGRLEIGSIVDGFVSSTLGLVVIAPIAVMIWKGGRRRYAGTGA